MDRLRHNFSERSSPLRFWLTVGLTTVVMMVAYTSFLFGFAAVNDAEATVVGSSIGTGVALVPLTFGVAAFLSGAPRSLLQVLKATGLWILLAPPIMIFDIILGLVVGFGVGSAWATHLPEGNRMAPRLITVGAVAAATVILLVIAPGAAVFGPMLALYPAMALVDRAAQTVTPRRSASDGQPPRDRG